MNIIEAVGKSIYGGKIFKRKCHIDRYWRKVQNTSVYCEIVRVFHFVDPEVTESKASEFSPLDIMADDWEVKDE